MTASGSGRDAAPQAPTGAQRAAGFSRRGPSMTSWPATLLASEPAWEQLTCPPFVVEDRQHASNDPRPRAALLLDWLADEAGGDLAGTMARGRGRCGGRWLAAVATAWLDDRGLHREWRQGDSSASLRWRSASRSSGPQLSWLLSGRWPGEWRPGPRPGPDPDEGFARLRALCDQSGVSRRAGRRRVYRHVDHRGQGRQSPVSHRRRRPGNARCRGRGPCRGHGASPSSTGCCTRWESSGRGAGQAAGTPHPRPAQPRGADRPIQARLPSGPRPAGGLSAGAPARSRLHQLEEPRQPPGRAFWHDLEPTTPASTACTCPSRSLAPGSSACGPCRKTVTERPARRPLSSSPGQLPRVPDPGAGLLPRPGPVGGRGPGPMGSVGGAMPCQRGGDRPAQVPAAPQVAHGRAHPRTAAGPPVLVRTVDERRKAAEASLAAAAGPARRGLHRRRARP